MNLFNEEQLFKKATVTFLLTSIDMNADSTKQYLETHIRGNVLLCSFTCIQALQDMNAQCTTK